LRLPKGRLAELHESAAAAGRSTNEWLSEIVLAAPALARTIRQDHLPREQPRAALRQLLSLVLGVVSSEDTEE
jgi:hypothetical protein